MRLKAGNIFLEVEEHGPPQGEPLLLIMGLGMQLVAWHDGFVEQLVARGFRVIRYDNRDIGLSQPFDHCRIPPLAGEAFRYALGWPVHSPYTLRDMADDAAGVLDALGIARAHVCGASMGGMIAQHLASEHAQRVRSLTLLMSSSGSRHLPGPTLRARAVMLSRPADACDVDSVVQHYVRLFRIIGSPGHPTDEARLRADARHAVLRSYRPQGTARQLLAIAADGDRSGWLGRIARPTQVIHGDADPLIRVAAGRDLAARIKDAVLDVVDGMGHDLPEALWPRLADGIAAAAGRA